MIFSEPINFDTADRFLAEKEIKPTGLTSAQIARDRVQFDRRGMFSAQTISAPLLQEYQNQLVKMARGDANMANGALWWQGWVSKIGAKGTTREEGQTVEVSDAFWLLENIAFQQMWVSSVVTGDAMGTITSTQGEVILGQALNGVQMNSGIVIMEALIYALYSCAWMPFPTVVAENNLPALPSALGPNGFTPFIIGAITPGVTVPFSQTRDKSCAEIIRLMLKFSPDCVTSFDMSTTPPTLNIAQRSALPVKTIKAVTARFPEDDYMVAGFNPSPRYDLMPPVVVVKFQQTTTLNGVTGSNLVVQCFPPAPAGIDTSVWESQPFALVLTLDLVGGQETQQSVDIKSIPRPITAVGGGTGGFGQVSDNGAAMAWLLKKVPQFIVGPSPTSGGTAAKPFYDVGHIHVSGITCTIDPSDPLNDPDNNPNNITLPACPQLVNELVGGHFPLWLQDDPNDLDAALVNLHMELSYTGGDPGTAALFVVDPKNPGVPVTAGTGVYIYAWKGKVTNADTGPYSQITSRDAGEPVPVGFAEYLWNCMAQLSFSGTFTITEQECTDRLPPGYTFNTVDGLAAWRAMNALVLRTEENLKTGTTRVTYGPPAHLGLDTMLEMFRAQLGRLPGWKLKQRTDGIAQTGSNVIGDLHAADTHVVPFLPGAGTAQIGPFKVDWRTNPDDSSGNTFQMRVTETGTLIDVNAKPITIGNLGTWVNLDANDTIWFEGPVTIGSTLSIPAVSIKSYGNGDAGLTQLNSYWVTGGLTENDGASPPTQTLYRKVIATFVANAEGKPSLKSQTTTTNLQHFIFPIQGQPACYPIPV